MKPIFLISLAGCLALCSCSKIIHPHEEVMSSYHTKQDVVKQFGQPDEKRELNELIEWLYNCDSASTFVLSKTKVRMHGTYNSVYGGTDDKSRTVTQFTPYIKYVKFNFDSKGNVIAWDTREVDFAEKKIKVGATVALVGGITYVVLSIVGYFAWRDFFDQLGKSAPATQ